MNERRLFLKKSFALVTIPITSQNLFSYSLPTDKILHLHNIHTGESIKATFWEKDHFVESELKRLDYFLRDYRLNKTAKIDRNLYKLLYAIQLIGNTKKPVEIISGYRTIQTNEILRKHSKGVAKHSFHTLAKAIDFNIKDRYLRDTLKIVKKLQVGGIGYYPKSSFIHIDTGRARFWRG
jgi:uncharacterized protein YcbK (DUF882 family)